MNSIRACWEAEKHGPLYGNYLDDLPADFAVCSTFVSSGEKGAGCVVKCAITPKNPPKKEKPINEKEFWTKMHGSFLEKCTRKTEKIWDVFDTYTKV